MEITMKYDWDLVRDILSRLHDTGPDPSQKLAVSEFPGHGAADVARHFQMLASAAMMCVDLSDDQPEQAKAHGLSFAGLQFVSKIRSDALWDKVKESIAHMDLSLSFHTIDAAATRYGSLGSLQGR